MKLALMDEIASIKKRIKEHEGFRNVCYKDSLGKQTIGWGHLCIEDYWVEGKEYATPMLNDIFEEDFIRAFTNANRLTKGLDLNPKAQGVIIEMVFQLGIGGVSKFKKMWKALEKLDYVTAANEMLDSKWHSQTKTRCEELSAIMESCT